MTRRIVLVQPICNPNRPDWHLYRAIEQALPQAAVLPMSQTELNYQQNDYYSDETFLFYHQQLLSSLKFFQQGDVVVLFESTWNPLITYLRYWSEIKQLDLKLVGRFTSAASLEHDLMHGSEQGRRLEQALLNALDLVLVGSDYLKRALLGPNIRTPIVVTSLPIPALGAKQNRRFGRMLLGPYRVLFNHRWSAERDPEKFLALVELALPLRGMKFVVTSNRAMPAAYAGKIEALPNLETHFGCSLNEYWDIVLSCDAVLSTAKQETFGFSMMEAIGAGLTPIAPAAFVYPELLRSEFLYPLAAPPETILRLIISHIDNNYALEEVLTPVGLRCRSAADVIANQLEEMSRLP